MPSGVADFGTSEWVQLITGVISIPASYYISLCTQEPAVAMDGTILEDIEPSGFGYSRHSYATGGSNWAANGNYVTNINDINFGNASGAWGLITHFALTDASSGGNLYAWGQFLNPQYVNTGFNVVVPAGGIVLSLASLESSIAV